MCCTCHNMSPAPSSCYHIYWLSIYSGGFEKGEGSIRFSMLSYECHFLLRSFIVIRDTQTCLLIFSFVTNHGNHILQNTGMIFLLVKKGRYISVRIYQQHIIATISVKGPPQMRTNVDL